MVAVDTDWSGNVADDRYHQLVIIWLRDPATFQKYLRLLPPIVARYGGAADLSLRPTSIATDGVRLPDIVNLVHYDDQQAFERFGADPDFAQIEPLRARSVDLWTFEGRLTYANPSSDQAADRVYDVELVDGGDEPATVAPRRESGYEIEYLLTPETAPAGIRRPDLIRIASFPSAAHLSAVKDTAWLTGTALH
jgi:hypothetical protein